MFPRESSFAAGARHSSSRIATALAFGALPLLAQAAGFPTAQTTGVSGVTAASALLAGTVKSTGSDASVWFDISTSLTFTQRVAATPDTAAAGAGSIATTGAATGLACGTTYNFRIHAQNAKGEAKGGAMSFTTAACGTATPPPPPSATAPATTTQPASGITSTGATFSASVVPGSAMASVTFQWGATTGYGASLLGAPSSLAASSSASAVTATVSGLACGTTYHYRATATSSAGTGNGADQAFTTAACAAPAPAPAPTGAYPWPTWTGADIAVPPSSTGITYYVDGTAGSDTNGGTSPTAAFKTIAKAVAKVAAGDTVLIRRGLYREGINLGNGKSGAAGKPITFGSYGDGEVILDGSTPVTNWTSLGGGLWQAQASFKPIGVVVNEVPLKQVRQGQGGSTAPQDGLAGVTPGSGKWYRSSSNLITADFGAVDPNSADLVVPMDSPAQEHVYWYGSSYLVFKGLTVRGNGSNGLWGYGSNITVDSCDIKFNGKAAVSFKSGTGTQNADNAVLYSHAYHNVLVNWPRGNNGYAEAGGGWPGTLGWETNLRPVARGNIVHMNGGEGIVTYGTQSGRPSGSALFEQNVAYDNWSVNMYFDNQPNGIARQNFLYHHPIDNGDFLYVGTKSPYDSLGKYSVCLMLADEEWSSDATNGYANLRGMQVHDNVIAGCRIAIRDYAEGSNAVKNHGVKDTTIVNNTILMPAAPIAGTGIVGIYLQDNKSPSGTQRNANSLIQNNVVVGFTGDPLVYGELAGAQGIAIDYNDYASPAAQPFGLASGTYSFASWKSATGADGFGKLADPMLVDVTAFRAAGPSPYDANKADVVAGSPTLGTGALQSIAPAANFRGVARTTWNIGAF